MNSVPAVTNAITRAAVAPNAPTGLTATASGTTTINLSWTAPVDNGGRIITGYKIEVSIDSGTTWTDLVADTASTTTTYEHTGLAASTRRDYRVSAINSIGTGTTPSDVAFATTGAPAVVTPTGNLLVSNLGQSSDDSPDIELTAQAFTTGAHAAGYTLTSIVLGCECGAYTTGMVTLHSGTRTGAKVADFTASPNAANQLVLTPTMATTLSANTTYVIVTSDDFNISGAFWFNTSTGNEDSGSATGWSIANDVELYRTSTSMWATSSGSMKIRVGGNAIGSTNNAPVVANAIPDQTATEGAAFSYQFPANTFNDVDTGDTLIYTATKADGTNLPTWLGFTPATRTFAGTPAATDVSVAVKVTATDTSSATVSNDFNIEVRAAAILHCNPSDPYEVFCATLTVAFDTPDYGFAIGNYGSLSPESFTYKGVTHRIGALYYSGSQLFFTTQQDDDSFATGFKLILDSVEFSLDGAWDADKVEYVVNNHGLSWSVDEMVEVKLVRLIPFSEKGPELEAPRGTEGWLQVRWGERAGATGVQAYNVEWRTVIREDEAYRFQRVDKSAREHHLYNLESGTEYEVRVCELSRIEAYSPNFDRGACSEYSRIRMPSRGSAPSNDIKVSIEFPEGGATKMLSKTLSTSDTVIRWRYRVTGIHNSSPEVFQSSAHGVAAGRVALQYRDETRQVTVYGTATFGALAPLIQDLDDLGIRMDWLVFDGVGSGYVEREFRVDPSFRTTTNRGPLMLYLLDDGERRYTTPELASGLPRLSPRGGTRALCVEFADAQGDVAVSCSSSQVEIDPPAVDGTPGVSGAGTDAQWSEGETVGVTVTFNEAVDVDTSGGAPSIGIGLGGTEARSATYASGTGTTELVFEYTLVTGDGSHGFMAITPDSLALNGGTIDSVGSGVAALLAHNGALTSGNTGNTQRSTAPAVTFADVPSDHDGETAFTVNVQFSGAPTGLSAKRDAASIFEVTGGSVTGARATTKGERPVWEVTVAPDVISDVTVRIPARACGEANAVCIGGQALVEAVEAVVPGVPEEAEVPITASFTQAPAAHDGASQFLLHLEFSHEPKRFSYRTVHNALFDIEGGSIEKVRRRVKGSNLQWEIAVVPEGDDAVTLTARATTDCAAQNATCDADGRKFAGGLTLMVPGPATLAEQTLPAVSIAPPAQTPAVEGDSLAFTLTRTGATDETLTVAVQVTETGNVLDGEPPASVTFAAGSTSATLSVATVDDETVEDAGTVTAAVSAGTGYEVSGTSGSAETVVEDDDAAPVIETASPLVVAENATAVATLVATDADTVDLTWSIPQGADGGADVAQFALTADGVLSFGTAKDYEAPDDANGDGEYEVTVRVTDGANPVDAALVVRLEDADDAPPALTGASVDGDQLTLTFGEALDEGSVPPASSFTVTVADSDNPVDEAAVSGDTVVLTLSSAVTSVETVTVGYTVPTGTDATPVQDAAGNRAASVADTQVTNGTAPALPTVSIAPVSTPVTEGTAAAFVLTRTGATDEALTVAVQVTQTGNVLDGEPPASVTFAAGSTSATLSVATVDDETVEDAGTVTAAVSAGTGYEVSGTSGSAETVVEDDDAAPVIETASPLVVAENATAVATLVATDADTVDLTWSIPQGADGGADAAQFALTADGVLSFGTAKDYEAPDDANGDGEYEVTVRVTDGANPVDAALVVRLEDADDAPPALTGASVDGDQLTLTFGEALDEGSVPPASSFTVTVADSDNPVDEAAVSGDTVVLTLSSAVTSVETVTVGYTVPTGTDATPVQDAAGNRAASVADTQVTNGTAPALPTVSIAPVSTPVTEGTAAAFVLTRTGAATAELTVTVQVTQAGSVLDGARPSTATFAPGAAETQITVATANDAIDEADAQVNASVIAGDGYEVDANNARAGVDVYDNDEAAQAVEELWSTTMTWSDLGNNWFGGFADGFTNPGWSEDGQAYSIWYISYDAGARTLRMAHDGSGGVIAEPGQLSLHIGELEVGPGDALEAFAGARVGKTADVDAKWSVGEQVSVRLTRASGDAEAAPAGPGFKVADAQVNEASGAPLQFRVTLDAPAQSTVSVRYGTANGTATAGQDYVAVRGALRFAPGETAKTVAVAVLPDEHNEGSETMTLTLSAPFGATITDGAATGTISNTGAIPQAWIARFGRTVADQVLDAVQSRMRAAPAPGVEVSLASQQIGVGSKEEQTASGEDARQEEEARRDALRVAEWLQRETEGGERQGGSRALSPRDLLTSSSFMFTEETPGKDLASLWGRAAVTRFDGREGDLTLDGEVVTGMLGADWRRGRWAAGLILSHSTGEGGYAGAPTDADGVSGSGTGGRVEATLTGLFPWARHTLSGRLEAWGAAGYGTGELTVTPKKPGTDKNGAAIRADLDLKMAAAGLRGTLLDGGDAETGFGLDLGAGLRLSDPMRGLEVEIRGRGLLSHESDGFRERGFSGALSWRQNPTSERGAVLTLTQTVGGSSSGGADALLSRTTLDGLAANPGSGSGASDSGGGDDELKSQRLELKFGYGMPAFGDRYTWTPEAYIGLSDTGRDYSLGWRLVRGGSGNNGGSLELSFVARRSESVNDDTQPVLAVGFTLTARF